ncbi:MAG: MASE3 domain-containing protein [Candidatus Electrothrix scaldis]|nr:MAG: MASE3 domain-containing protein [Candidatus Electrothrix sp. GW3-3]
MKADPAPVRRRFSPACLVPFAIIFGLYLANVYNHLLFHALAELFSIIFISSIFLFTWNTRRFQENHYFLFLGIAYLFIGSIDFVHILTYKDGGDMLSEITMNSSIQFWVAARYMEGTSLLLAFLFLHKKINEYLLVLLYLLLTVLLFQSILGGSFPVCFVTGQGLTVFKKGSECAVCFLYLLTLFFFYKKQHQFEKRTLRFLQVSVSLTVLAELTAVFSAEFYNTPLDTTAGIFGKLFSLYCLAKAIFESSLIRPYNILISKLRAHEEQLEDKIRERTAALQQSTEQLEKEVIERVKVEKELVWELSVNKALASLSDALISRSYSMQEIAGALFDAAQRLTGCHQGFVSIVDHENATASIYPGTDPLASGKEMPVFVLSAQEDGQFPGLWGQTLNTQQGFCVDFISSQIQEDGGLPASLEPQRNFLNAPALLDNKVVGQIALADKPGGFSRHDLLAIERLAALFALFVHRREMEDALSRSEFEYRSLFDEALDMIHIVDAQKKITRVNPVELKTLGYREEQLVGMSLLDIVHPDYQERTKQNLEHIFLTGESVKNYETALVTQDGVSVNIEVSAVPQLEQGQVVSVRAIMRNITDRKREEREKKNLEVQLRHSQKMEAVGTLAGGIAHDFNNILGPIFGYTELALDVLPEDNRITSWLQEVLQASHRARELVRQILTISRKADKDVQPLRIQLLIKEALKLLRFSIPSNIEIRQQLAPDCKPVLADPTRIHQIIMNLCTNAYYAMRENGGILEVSLQQVMLRQEELYDKIRLQEGAYLQLTVRDNGTGIPKELLEKIFEPYFTTKSQGEGTGLGLAVVQSIVLDFGGDITVSSVPGQGTVFDVYFPVIQTEEETVLPQEKASLPRGDERILVVDDDRDIVLMNQRILEMLGYQVRAWTESLEAFADFQQDPDAVDLVITDMTMPKMTGDELTRRLLALRPELPVLICTGFSELIDEDKARKLGARALLMKPLTKKELAWAVRQVLDQEK